MIFSDAIAYLRSVFLLLLVFACPFTAHGQDRAYFLGGIPENEISLENILSNDVDESISELKKLEEFDVKVLSASWVKGILKKIDSGKSLSDKELIGFRLLAHRLLGKIKLSIYFDKPLAEQFKNNSFDNSAQFFAKLIDASNWSDLNKFSSNLTGLMKRVKLGRSVPSSMISSKDLDELERLIKELDPISVFQLQHKLYSFKGPVSKVIEHVKNELINRTIPAPASDLDKRADRLMNEFVEFSKWWRIQNSNGVSIPIPKLKGSTLFKSLEKNPKLGLILIDKVNRYMTSLNDHIQPKVAFFEFALLEFKKPNKKLIDAQRKLILNVLKSRGSSSAGTDRYLFKLIRLMMNHSAEDPTSLDAVSSSVYRRIFEYLGSDRISKGLTSWEIKPIYKWYVTQLLSAVPGKSAVNRSDSSLVETQFLRQALEQFGSSGKLSFTSFWNTKKIVQKYFTKRIEYLSNFKGSNKEELVAAESLFILLDDFSRTGNKKDPYSKIRIQLLKDRNFQDAIVKAIGIVASRPGAYFQVQEYKKVVDQYIQHFQSAGQPVSALQICLGLAGS